MTDTRSIETALEAATAALPGTSKFLGRREIKELPSLLWEGEYPERLIQGMYHTGNGVLVATNRRLIFIDKGMMSLKVEDFAYDRITSVQFNTGMLLGTVTIYAAGNKAEIKNVDKGHARAFGEWLRSRIMGADTEERAPGPAAAATETAATSADPLERLERAARLRDAGVLTEEEFQQQKSAILGGP